MDDEPFLAVDLDGDIAWPCRNVISSVLVTRSRYDADLRRAFASADEVRAQARLDFPRSSVEIDGSLRTTPPVHVPIRDLAWCTQSVMGLPVERLHRAGLAALEPAADCKGGRAMHVRLDSAEREVVAWKALRVLPLAADPALHATLAVLVLVHAQRDHVRIDYVQTRDERRRDAEKTLSVAGRTTASDTKRRMPAACATSPSRERVTRRRSNGAGVRVCGASGGAHTTSTRSGGGGNAAGHSNDTVPL